MSSRADIQAGKAFVELTLKDSSFTRGLALSMQKLKDFGAGLSGIGFSMLKAGGAIVAPFAAATMHFVRTGDALGDMADRTGIAASRLAELKYAADRSETSIEDVEKALRKMAIAIQKLRDGGTEAQQLFRKLSLDAEDFKGKSLDEQFALIADRLGSISDVTKKISISSQIFGKAGSSLLPLLTNLKALREEARREGLIPSDQAIKAAGDIDDAFKKVRASTSATAFEIGAVFAPAVLEALDAIRRVSRTVRDWVAGNQEVLRVVSRLGVATILAGAGFIAMGKSIAITGAVLEGMWRIGKVFQFLVASPLAVAKSISKIGSTKGAFAPVTKAASAFRKMLAGIGSEAKGAASAVTKFAQQSAAAMRSAATGRSTRGLGQIAAGVGAIGLTGGRLLAQGIVGEIRAASPAISRALRGAVSLGGRGASSLGSGLTRMFTPVAAAASRAFAVVGSKARSAFAPIGSAFRDQFATVGSKINSKLAPIWQRIGPRFRAAFFDAAMAGGLVGDKVSAGFRSATRVAASTARSVARAWNTVGPQIARGLTSSVNGAFRRIRSVGAGAAKAVGSGAGKIASGAGNVVSGIASIAGTLGGKSGGALGKALGTFSELVPEVMAFGSALFAIASPLALVVAGVAGAVYAWTQFSDSSRSALSAVMNALQPFIDTFKKTFDGIRDALAAGDLALAASIGIQGVKVAFLQGINALSSAVGGEWGDFVGKLGSEVASGDFSGAWTTVVTGMQAIWAGFCESLTAVFTESARAVTKVWQDTVEGIANWMLKKSSEGGVMGSLMSKILGVDMKAEQERLDKINAGLLKTQHGKAGAGGPNVLEGARADVAAQVKAKADAARSALDQMDRDAQAKNREAAAALGAHSAGGAAQASAATDQAAQELDDLRRKAAEARKKAEEADAAQKAKLEGVGDTGDGKKEVFGTFSAAAAVANAGQGIGNRIAKATEETNKKLDENKRALAGVRRGIDNLAFV